MSMTGTYLYPIVELETLFPSPSFRGWWTVVWMIFSTFLCLLFLWKNKVRNKKSSHKYQGISLSTKSVIFLEENLETISAQQRYREYQSCLRDLIHKRYDIDIHHVSLVNIVENSLPELLVNLLQETYYYPYNMEKGDRDLMKSHLERILAV